MTGTNTLKRRLDEGEVLYGAGVETGAPSLIEIYGHLGLDWVWLDLEHKNRSPYDSIYVERLVRAAEASDTELIVRIPTGEPAMIRKLLDTGVRNVVVPRVRTAEEVRRAVRAAYFEYDGGPGARGLSQGKTSDYGSAFAKDGDVDYVAQEDGNVLIGVLIEDIEAVRNLDEILDVPGLGFVFPGPGDLGVSMGTPLEYGNPEVESHIAAIRDSCVERDIPVLGVHGSNFVGEEETKREIENGYQLVGIGNDFKAVRQVLSDRLTWFE